MIKIIYTEDGKINEVQTILNFNKVMNKFSYGLAINGVIDKNRNTTSEDYDKFYKFASPETFKKQNGGICWDFVTYEANYFTKNIPNVKYDAYYVIFDDGYDLPTHTFIILECDGKYIYFESSFKAIRGVYESDSKESIINYVLYAMDKYPKKRGLLRCPYYVFKYNPLDHGLYNLSCSEFMKYIEEHGIQIEIKFNKNFNITKF